jgi:hypothetical protein
MILLAASLFQCQIVGIRPCDVECLGIPNELHVAVMVNRRVRIGMRRMIADATSEELGRSICHHLISSILMFSSGSDRTQFCSSLEPLSRASQVSDQPYQPLRIRIEQRQKQRFDMWLSSYPLPI